MSIATRRSLPPILALIALVLAACGGPAPSPATPSATGSAPSSAAATSEPPSPTTVPSPTVASTATAEACAVVPETGRLPSDRMVDVVISSSETADLVTFVFGDVSVPDPPQGASEGHLEPAVPPYTQGASGLPIEIDGEHVITVRFTGMSIVNDVGQPTYDGRMDFRPDLPALRTLVNYDMFEGVIGWYLGYDGGGCVSLTSDARSVTLAIEHPAS